MQVRRLFAKGQPNKSALAAGRLSPSRVALSIWIVSLTVICVLVFLAPLKTTVTGVYHSAVTKWLTRQPLYLDSWMYAFYYFPQFVFIFMPFHFLPIPVGDILWRAASTGLLAWGLWRIVDEYNPRQRGLLFLGATIIALAPCLGAMKNGQANVMFAALSTHAAACLARSSWRTAAFCLLGALGIKPIGLVMLVLAVMGYRALILPLFPGMALFLSFPFLFARPSYVLLQYQQSIERLYSSSLITEHRFADVNGLLQTLGIGLTGSVSQGIRIMAGLMTAMIWLVAAERTREPKRSCLLLGLAATYLMLFNPMTEGNSYVIVAPILAVYAISFLLVDGHRVLGTGLAFMSFSVGLLPEMLRSADQDFGLWWRPAMMLIFSAVLIYVGMSQDGRAPIPRAFDT